MMMNLKMTKKIYKERTYLSSFFVFKHNFMIITYTKGMTISYVIIVILILIICSNLLLSLEIKYHLEINMGSIQLKLFKVPILIANFSIKQNIVEIDTKNKKIKFDIKFSKKELKLAEELSKNIKTKIYIKQIDLHSLICLENAFACSIISGLYQIIIDVLLLKLKSDNSDTKISNNINTGFRHNMISVKASIDISASIFDILWALFSTLIQIRRINNEERRKSKCRNYDR